MRLDQSLVEKANIWGKAHHRTTPKQIEYWAKIGEIMEDNPDWPFSFVQQALLAQSER
ncbi:ParD-like family protein [Thiomicrorhabdus sp. Milos-T2]|uniref:ParD-like family protein n=1 Tax=Thiomicrorhabdus sp. Milos-T2 TaxID=90814 RepID=UPI000B2A7551|nr:ParD-like family protein [Thiomicrorhabdus sp. Milos-T2]